METDWKKYYAPSLEDFVLGLEYQIYDPDNESQTGNEAWKDEICSKHRLPKTKRRIMCSTKITRENFIAEFGSYEIETNLPDYKIVYVGLRKAAFLFDIKRYNEIGKPLTTIEQVHALYKALMHEDFKLK